MKPVDFKKLVQDIDARGGFDLYPPAVQETAKPEFNPLYPGHFPYENGKDRPGMRGISQQHIDLHYQSIRDALRFYMPAEVIARHMCRFVQKDFARNAEYRYMRRYKEDLPHLQQAWTISGKYSFNLATPHRRQDNGEVYFTRKELRLAHDLVRTFPALKITMWVFHAAFVDYLQHLTNAISRAKNLEDDKKDRALETVRSLNNRFTSSEDFIRELLPAICLAYHAADPTHKAPWTADVFDKGFEAALHFGMFRSMKINTKTGEQRSFRCPAMATITMASSFGMAAYGSAPMRMTRGTMLAMIYQRVQQVQTPAAKPAQP